MTIRSLADATTSVVVALNCLFVNVAANSVSSLVISRITGALNVLPSLETTRIRIDVNKFAAVFDSAARIWNLIVCERIVCDSIGSETY